MKKFSKKFKIIFVIMLLLLVSWGYYIYKNYDSLFWGQEENIPTEFENIEAVVEKKSFDFEIEKNWTTKIKNEQKIKFNTAWRITQVNFKVWDEVKKWQVIVSIDASKAQSDINKASTELDKARRNLDKIVNDLKDVKLKSAILDLEVARTSIENKEKDLVFMKEKQKNDLISKKNELETAKNSFIIEEAKIKKDLAVSRFDNKNSWNSLTEKNISYDKQKRDYEDFKNNFQTKLDKKVNEYKQKLENIYYDLEKDEREFEKVFKNVEIVLAPNYSPYFSAKNSLTIWKIKEYYYKAWSDFEKFKSAYKEISWKNDWKNIVKTLEAGRDFYENAHFMFTYLQQWFDDSVEVSSYKPTTNERESWLTSIDWFNPGSESSKFSWGSSRASSMRTSITSTIDELKNFDSEEKIKKDLQDELEKSRIALENTEVEIKKFIDEKDFTNNTTDASQKNMIISLEEAKNSLNQKILEFSKFEKTQQDEYRAAEIAIEKEKIAYKTQSEEFEKLKNLSKNDEYLSAEESVKQAELNLETAQKWLENFIIQAPFDWVITKMDYLVWDRITENSEQYVSIVDPKTIEVLIDINQSEIIKVKKDMAVKVILDSYKENILDWTIIELDTTPKMDERTWLSKFSAKVLIWDYGDLQLYTGMQAIVKIKVDSIPESLVVPFSAVNSEEDGRKYVTAIENWKKVKKYVEVWFSDGVYYQIISWLKEWEKILEIDYDASKIKEDENNFGYPQPI